MEEKNLLHKISMLDRKQLNISGVLKVLSSNPSCIVLKLSNTDIEIHGNELTLESFNENNIEIKGNIDLIKYSKNFKVKESLFKRVFK